MPWLWLCLWLLRAVTGPKTTKNPPGVMAV